MGALSSWRISAPSKGICAAQLPHQWEDLTFFLSEKSEIRAFMGNLLIK